MSSNCSGQVCVTDVCDTSDRLIMNSNTLISYEDIHAFVDITTQEDPCHILMMLSPRDLEKSHHPGQCRSPCYPDSDAELSTDVPPSSDPDDGDRSSRSDYESPPRSSPTTAHQERALDTETEDLEERIRKIRLSYQEADLAFDEESIFYLDDDEVRAYDKICKESVDIHQDP